MIEWASLIILVVIFFIIFKIVKKILFTILIFILIIILFTSGMAYYVYDDIKNLQETFGDEPKYLVLEDNGKELSIIEIGKLEDMKDFKIVESFENKDYIKIYVNIEVIEEGYKEDEKVKKVNLLKALRGEMEVAEDMDEKEFRGMMFMYGFSNIMDNAGKDFLIKNLKEGKIRMEPEPFVLKLMKKVPDYIFDKIPE